MRFGMPTRAFWYKRIKTPAKDDVTITNCSADKQLSEKKSKGKK